MSEFEGWNPSFVETNGIRMAVHEAGTPGDGPSLVFCHGFPELGFSWRNQARDLAKAGFHVLVPDQRGYGLTDRPEEVEAYDLDNLNADLAGLLDAKGVEKAVFVGHDWGGVVVWGMALRHPDRVAGIIALNTPFTPRPPVEPITMMKEHLGEDMYVVWFQQRGPADQAMAEDVRKTMSMLFKRPVESSPEALGVFSKAPEEGKASPLHLKAALAAYDAASDPREDILPPEELDFYVETFERTGFTGGLNWYRNATRNWENSEHLPNRIDVPSLMITSELDPYLPPAAAEGMERFIDDLDRHFIKGCGHWTQQEKAEEVTQTIQEWMDRKFPEARRK
ncbi:alpha/beta fold hydrolase [Novosphingobium pentaromativorans]|uniref:Epoxide hydrolase n=2 Tax=Novosphingobium pentaromativorans TaxID=205844 RepID=G6E7X7_9SPHN|nr:alpha/beta hydrolase [Novosphingobium pentaromativorans]AIT81502.1 epoxide hydrolase [Novosphingobium pentaromativorans US6-1]EHJ62620.1 epoxide hydrolase [Novosphingobium pentaromativorans US6-1]